MLFDRIGQVRTNIKKNLEFDNRVSAVESKARGKQLRKETPRSSHATWEAPAARPDIVDLLKSQEKSRVQELVPIRHERMSASAFTFYRGAALIMANDLSHTPTSGTIVQACGDAHVSNFGLFQSPERRLVFDINDFDETARAPWEWDVKRLTTSIEVCARNRAFTPEQRDAAVLATVRAYRNAMLQFADMGTLDVWYAHADVESLYAHLSKQITKPQLKNAQKTVAKARQKNSLRAVSKFTEVVDGNLRIVSQPPLIVPMRDLLTETAKGTLPPFNEEEQEAFISLVLSGYLASLSPEKRHLVKQYRGVDIARKVVGVGSVGMRAWIVVMEGNSSADPLVLQIKEAEASVLERYTHKSKYLEHGRRVVEGQRAMQTSSDILLGWTRILGLDGKKHDYYVRQLWDGKGSFNVDGADPETLTLIGRTCGWTLAHAHARTGNRFEIAGYLGKSTTFDEAICAFSRSYADQNEQDYQRFLEALDNDELA